jgi:hypothetical protein
MTLLFKKNVCCEIQRSENRMKLEESPKEGYGSKRGCFANDDDDDDINKTEQYTH